MNEITLFLSTNYRFFGLAGCLVIIAAMVFTAAGYSGRKQEKYSALNHYISELGEAGISGRAWAFNYGLIVGGLLLIPFIIGFGIYLNNLWAVLAIVSGVWAAVSCVLVGVFPMNNLNPHIKAAVSYFPRRPGDGVPVRRGHPGAAGRPGKSYAISQCNQSTGGAGLQLLFVPIA